MPSESDPTPLKPNPQLEAAQRISETLFQHLEIDDLVELTLATALQEVGAEAGSILLVDQDSRQLVFHHSIGMAPVPRGTVIGWDQGIVGKVFQSQKPALIHDVKKNEHHFAGIDALTGYRTRDMISLPLKQWKGEPIGVLTVINKRAGRLDESDLALLTVVSAFAALAIKQARLYEEAKLGEVVRLIGNIGHDLKNFLQPIVSGAWLIQQEVERAFPLSPKDGGDHQRGNRQICDEALAMIQKTIGRLHDRFKEIADCVKGLSTPAQFLPCRLDVVVGDVLQTLRILAAEKDIALTARKLDILPLIRADHRRLYNAFYNLVNNAIPEVPKGGSISVSGQLEDNGQGVVVSVSDTGRGMPQEIKERLFTSGAISTKSGGTGLGTKIVKDVIDAHRGKITVESDVGKGTTFHIHLPLDPDQMPEQKD